MIDGQVYPLGYVYFGLKKIIKNIFYGMKAQNMKIAGEE